MQANNTVITANQRQPEKKKSQKPKRKKYTLPMEKQVTRIQSEPSIKNQAKEKKVE